MKFHVPFIEFLKISPVFEDSDLDPQNCCLQGLCQIQGCTVRRRKFWRGFCGGDEVIRHVDGHLPGVVLELDEEVGEVRRLVDSGEHVLLVTVGVVGSVGVGGQSPSPAATAGAPPSPQPPGTHLPTHPIHFHL